MTDIIRHTASMQFIADEQNVQTAYRFENIENKDGFYVFHSLKGTEGQTGANYGIIFIAIKPCEVLAVSEVHGVAGNDAGAVTLDIERLQGTEALDAGDSMLVSAFNLKGTANTVQSKSSTDLQNTRLNAGDRIALKDSGTLTNISNLNVTLYIKPLGKGDYR